jgi:large conductance mechanosensitive channel
MSFVAEFKEFALKGNVVDLAVGVIIGGAFGKIVTSLIENVIMPPIGLVTGGVDFSQLAVTLKAAQGDTPAVLWKYGAFVQTVFDFVLLALCIFAMVKIMNQWKRKAEEVPPAPEATPADIVLLSEIRDLLKGERPGANPVASE